MKLNLHMQHMEDCVIEGNLSEISEMILDYARYLNDNPAYQYLLTIKYDGAPAIFAWTKFSGLEKPGVAMKGVFNLTPKVFYTKDDLKDLPEDLRYKFEVFLDNFPGIPKNEIWQGDFLFDDKSLKYENINGKETLCFHPNALLYTVPDILEKQIKKSKIGIVWHTIYKGDSLKDVDCNFYVDIDRVKRNKNVFMIDAIINPAHIRLTKAEIWETNQIHERIKLANQVIFILAKANYKQLTSNEDFKTYFKLYQNHVIKERAIENSFSGLMYFVKKRFEKEISEKKSEKGKQNTQEKRDKLVSLIKDNEEFIEILFHQIHAITCLKNLWIKAFEKTHIFDAYLKTTEGKIEKTNQEGYALSNNKNIIKIVDREVFSYANFSSHIVKGWSKIKDDSETKNI